MRNQNPSHVLVKASRDAKYKADKPSLKQIKHSVEWPCFDYKTNSLKQFEANWYALNHYHIEFLHGENTSYGNFLAVESLIKLGPVAMLQKDNEPHFYGVYAKQALRFPLNLGEYLGEIRSIEVANQDDDISYSFDLTNGTEINAKYKRSWHAMVNGTACDEAANVNVTLTNGKVYYSLKRNIKADEQLLVYYGDDYCFSDKRFLNVHHNWLESQQIFDQHAFFYQEKSELDPNLLKLLQLTQTMFVLPEPSVLTVECINLPGLAYDDHSDRLLPQNQQENITALHLACWQAKKEEVAQLLEKGADSNQQTSISGWSALHFIVLADYDLLTKTCLLERVAHHPGTSLKLQNSDEETILHLAIKTKQYQLIDKILCIDKKLVLYKGNSLKSCVNSKSECYLLQSIATHDINILNSLKKHVTSDEFEYYLNDFSRQDTLKHYLKTAHDQLHFDQWQEIEACIRSFVAKNQKLHTILNAVMLDVKKNRRVVHYNNEVFGGSQSSMAHSTRPIYDRAFPLYDDELAKELQDEIITQKVVQRPQTDFVDTFFKLGLRKKAYLLRTKAPLFGLMQTHLLSIHGVLMELLNKELDVLQQSNLKLLIPVYHELCQLIKIHLFYHHYDESRRKEYAPKLHHTISVYWMYAFIHAVSKNDLDLFITDEQIKQKLKSFIIPVDIQSAENQLLRYAQNNVHFLSDPRELMTFKTQLKEALHRLSSHYLLDDAPQMSPVS